MGNPLLNKALAAYAGSNNTLPPLLAVVRLYEKSLSHLHVARSNLVAKRFIDASKEIDKVVAITAGLEAVVQNVEGDDIGAQLRRFYRMIIIRTGRIIANRDPVAAVDTVIGLWTRMLEAWRDVANAPRSSPDVGTLPRGALSQGDTGAAYTTNRNGL
jgi:flagellar protein FliS